MRFEQMLNERFVNVFTPDEKKAYMDELWNLLELTYAEIKSWAELTGQCPSTLEIAALRAMSRTRLEAIADGHSRTRNQS